MNRTAWSALRCAPRLLPALLALLLLAAPAAAQPAHPFRGEVLDLVSELEAVRAGETLEAREAAATRLVERLYRDRFLAELGPRVDLPRFVRAVAQGQPFDAAGFRAAAEEAIARGGLITSTDVGEAELRQKLQVLELGLATRGPARPLASAPPLDGEAVARSRTAAVLGPRDTRVMPMESVPGASVLLLNERVELPAGESREAVALDLYGRVLAPTGADGTATGRGELRAGLAHREVGRAVLGPDVRHPFGAESADVLKGVGPTPWAANGNRFNSKATGTFPLPEAVRDWNATETLRAAGVAVYEPVAVVALPHMEWSESEGWRPIAVYVRRGRENLRVSDLDHLSDARKRALVESLRGKIAAELEGVGRPAAVGDLDVIRHFVERVGRTAGLFQGGMGQLYFHGMLHDQNVSLLGEIVDVGNSDGVRESREEMRRSWEASNYTWWPERLPEYRDLRGNVETALFHRMAHRFNERFASVTGGGLPEAELRELFARAYREGRRGVSAADPRQLLTVAVDPAVARTAEKLEPYRRADGTLDWGRMSRDRALQEGVGLGHFALALFLKEVAVVAATGDRARIEEFFEGLLTTDFYVHYGLFVAGARVGEVAYTRYLQRFVKPRFVSGMLKTNLVLAAGMALPLIVEGKFEGKAFAISLGALGLSTAAVKAGVAGISWVLDLERAKGAGTLARFGAGAGRLARLGGWFYTAAELAVILYLGEEIETRVHAALDQAAAERALGAAGEAFVAAAHAARTPEELAAAAEAYHEAWLEYRNHLYAPLYADEAVLAGRLEKLARAAKLAADERAAALTRVREHTALRASVERRYGSLEAYADHLVREDEAELQRDADAAIDSYNEGRERHLLEVYRGNRRGEGLLADVDHLEWLLAGGAAGAAGDPYGARDDVLARFGRSRARAALTDALASPSRNRLEAYDDEAAVLQAVAASLRARGRADLAGALDERRVAVRALAAADARLIEGGGLIDASDRAALTRAALSAEGLVGSLEEAAGR